MNGLPGMPGGMPGGFPAAPQAPIQTAVPGAAAQPEVHICFSGALTCSGCFPCDECAQVVKQNVLVMALIEEQRVLALDLQQALQQGRPLNLQLLAETFFRTAANAYRQLHAAMLSEPPERRPFRVANISAIMEAANAYRALMISQQQAAQAAAGQPTHANPPNPPNPPPQNIAQPVASAPPAPASVVIPPTNLSAVIPQQGGVDFRKASEMRGDVITVQAEDPGNASAPVAGAPPAASPPTPSRPAVSKAITADDFKNAAPPANGSSQTS